MVLQVFVGAAIIPTVGRVRAAGRELQEAARLGRRRSSWLY
jgi:hypothetical protein